MNNKSFLPIEIIEKRIFLIRGEKVMLGFHLAELYDVETRVLMQAVRRNSDRFPDDFMFALTRKEIMRISQFVTSLKYSKVVFAFTEQGIAMLSGILNSQRAIQVNITIMRAFVKLRKLLASNKEFTKRLDELEQKYDYHFKIVFDAIRQLMTPPDPPKRRIGFGVEEPKSRYNVSRKK